MYFTLFIFIFILFFLIFIYFYIDYTNDIEVCKKLYIDDDNKKYKIIKNIFSKNDCKNIINEANKYANEYGWKTKRHDYYPTVDNEITKEWDCYKFITKNIIEKIIYTEIEKLYNLKKNKLSINEIFIVKYFVDEQDSLEFHKDGSEFSFVIALNQYNKNENKNISFKDTFDYDGGWTYFRDNKILIKLNEGDCLIFSGKNTHKANKITSGKRYILTGFLNYINEDFCNNTITETE